MATTFLANPPQPGDNHWTHQQNTGYRGRYRGRRNSYLRHQPHPRHIPPGFTVNDVENDGFISRGMPVASFLQYPNLPQTPFTPQPWGSHLRKEHPAWGQQQPPTCNAASQPPTPFSDLRPQIQHPPIHSTQRQDCARDTAPQAQYTTMVSTVSSPKTLAPHLRNQSITAATSRESTNPGQSAQNETHTKPQPDLGVMLHPPRPPTPPCETQVWPQSPPKQAVSSTWAKVDEWKQSSARPPPPRQNVWNGENPTVKLTGKEPTSPRGRAQHRGGQGFSKREARWPKRSDMKADPQRWEIKWVTASEKSSGTCFNSLAADFGYGDVKKDRTGAGFELTDWDGNWAPAPLNWDARPAFRATQSASQIEAWMSDTKEKLSGMDCTVVLKEDMATSDIAPQFWVPIVIGDKAPRTFWNELVKSSEVEPIDQGDLDNVKPWWELYQIPNSYFLQSFEAPDCVGFDPDEEDRGQRLARENDQGSNHHAENRKKIERAKLDAQRQRRKKPHEKTQNTGELATTPKINPALRVSVRQAKTTDLREICDIYNRYVVEDSAAVPEVEPLEIEEMKSKLDEVSKTNKLPFLVAFERGAKLHGRKKWNQDNVILPDRVIGFGYAKDYDSHAIYRATAEVKIFIDNRHYMQGIAKCLMDKLLALLDEGHVERGGYNQDENLEHLCIERKIQQLVVNFSYDKPERLIWVRRWLCESLAFKQAGNLEDVGMKGKKSINVAIFQRKTGTKMSPGGPAHS